MLLEIGERNRSDADTSDYSAILRTLSELRGPVDQFFDDVLVMAEDLNVRANRSALLKNLADEFLQVADISHLQA